MGERGWLFVVGGEGHVRYEQGLELRKVPIVLVLVELKLDLVEMERLEVYGASERLAKGTPSLSFYLH